MKNDTSVNHVGPSGRLDNNLTLAFPRTLFIEIFQFSWVQDGIYALGKTDIIMRSTPSLRRFPNVALRTVPVLVWLPMALSPRPVKEDRWALPLSTPLSSRRSMVWCPWLCARRYSVSSSSTLQIFRAATRLLWSKAFNKACMMI